MQLRYVKKLKSGRNVVKTDNNIQGMHENEIHVQADGIYNNSLFSGVRKTPFQPEHQLSYIVEENVIPNKHFTALENVKKNFALSMDFTPLRTASAILCLVAVLQQFQWRRPLKMRKNGPKTAFWI